MLICDSNAHNKLEKLATDKGSLKKFVNFSEICSVSVFYCSLVCLM